jgi:hypothetical protein
MSVAAAYEIRVLSPAGVVQKVLDQWGTLTISRGLNTVGTLNLTLPYGLIETYITPDMRLEVWRAVNDGPWALFLNQTWFLRKPDITFSSNTYSTKITAFSALDLLGTRTIAANDGTSGANKTGNADNLIKQYSRENIGSSGGTGRDLSSYITIESDLSAAPSLTKTAARRPLLQTCQELAQASATAGTLLYFDIVGAATISGLALRTYTGQYGTDRRFPSGFNPLVLSPDAGNLDDATYSQDYSQQATYIYAGGKGQGNDKIVGTASDTGAINASPFGRREVFVSASNADTTAAANAEANTALRARRVRSTLTGKIVQNETTIFGIHWGLGDLVTAQFAGKTIDSMIEAISISLQNGEESITGQLRSLS